MLRDNIINGAKFIDATKKAAVALKTGMGVVITSGKAALASAATGVDVFLVQKNRIATGVNAVRTEFSDYEEEFNTVKADEAVLLVKYHAGESFLTDQYATGLNAGERVVAGADGKWAKADTNVTSIYVFVGTVNDNGHTLAKIEVSDTAVKNS